ncbi:MAG: hypothetical protein IPP77_11550 [Bacteroidetes bacterium]|nr:hypothetical protein [Bacteroidota bacterium]
MKKYILLLLLPLLLAATTFAQVPQKMNYQAVVRDNSGQPLSNGTNVTVRFMIHNGTMSRSG